MIAEAIQPTEFDYKHPKPKLSSAPIAAAHRQSTGRAQYPKAWAGGRARSLRSL